MSLRTLELFSGIGGCAFALRGLIAPVLAVDQDLAARQTYARHHPGTPLSAYNLHAVTPGWLAKHPAELWWMSPPCQPYTIRGHQRDLADRRSAAFIRICQAIDALRPPMVALENVPWFRGSEGEALLLSTLDRNDYAVHTEILCPTTLGIPAERRRYYLVASREGLLAAAPRPRVVHHVRDFLLDDAPPDLDVPADLARRYAGALHIVDADDPEGRFACFTSAYGRSPVYAGSYLRHQGRLRALDPREIAATLGHPTFDPPPDLGRAKRYKLIGNSLSVPALRAVLTRLPALRDGLVAPTDT